MIGTFVQPFLVRDALKRRRLQFWKHHHHTGMKIWQVFQKLPK
jgi:hypothetical protein